MFNTAMVAGIERALDDKNSHNRMFAVKFFIAVIAQGAFHRSQGIFILKYLQRASATRYLTPQWSLDLNVR